MIEGGRWAGEKRGRQVVQFSKAIENKFVSSFFLLDSSILLSKNAICNMEE